MLYKGRRIVICGSMSNLETMHRIQHFLLQKRIPCITPHVDPELAFSTQESYEAYKRKASRHYITQIKNPKTFGILVANVAKHGIENYIGANAFGEIAIAFANNKKIYLLNNYATTYVDELRSWNTIPLKGDLANLVLDFKDSLKRIQPLSLPGINFFG